MPTICSVLFKNTVTSVISFVCPGQKKHSDSVVCNKQKHLGKHLWQKKKPSNLPFQFPGPDEV